MTGVCISGSVYDLGVPGSPLGCSSGSRRGQKWSPTLVLSTGGVCFSTKKILLPVVATATLAKKSVCGWDEKQYFILKTLTCIKGSCNSILGCLVAPGTPNRRPGGNLRIFWALLRVPSGSYQKHMGPHGGPLSVPGSLRTHSEQL